MSMQKLRLKPEDYDFLDKVVSRKNNEFYTIVLSKVRGKFVRSVHVFQRQPMTTELKEFENTSSKMKIRASRTDVEGSQIVAYAQLYDHLIDRSYNVPVGWELYGKCDWNEQAEITSGQPLDRAESRKIVPAVLKREALRDVVGEHYSEARVDEMVGEDEEVGAGAVGEG